MPCGTCRKTFTNPVPDAEASQLGVVGRRPEPFAPRPREPEGGRSARFPGPPGGRLVLPPGGSGVESAVRRQQPVTQELQPGHCRGRPAEQGPRRPFRPGIPVARAAKSPQSVAAGCGFGGSGRAGAIRASPCSRVHSAQRPAPRERQPGLTVRGSISQRCRPVSPRLLPQPLEAGPPLQRKGSASGLGCVALRSSTPGTISLRGTPLA